MSYLPPLKSHKIAYAAGVAGRCLRIASRCNAACPTCHEAPYSRIGADSRSRVFARRPMRLAANAVVISVLSSACLYAHAAGLDDARALAAALQAKADQAPARDRCFLYAKLVGQMTDVAGQQLNSGDSGGASETLKLVQQYAEKIHTGVAGDSKKLKDAELLMRRTSFRLKDILGEASLEDRQVLEMTLMQLDLVQSQLMTQVFKH